VNWVKINFNFLTRSCIAQNSGELHGKMWAKLSSYEVIIENDKKHEQATQNPKIESIISCRKFDPLPKLYESSSFWVTLLTDRRRDKQTKLTEAKHILLDGRETGLSVKYHMPSSSSSSLSSICYITAQRHHAAKLRAHKQEVSLRRRR